MFESFTNKCSIGIIKMISELFWVQFTISQTLYFLKAGRQSVKLVIFQEYKLLQLKLVTIKIFLQDSFKFIEFFSVKWYLYLYFGAECGFVYLLSLSRYNMYPFQ